MHKSLLDFYFILVLEHALYVLAKDTENKPVNYEPAILPEEAEEALHLVEGYHLREDAHDPGLTDHHEVDLVFEVDD